jgi:hypothetical protein
MGQTMHLDPGYWLPSLRTVFRIVSSLGLALGLQQISTSQRVVQSRNRSSFLHSYRMLPSWAQKLPRSRKFMLDNNRYGSKWMPLHHLIEID